MKKSIERSLYLFGGIFCLILAWMTGTGEILNYIPFADPLNEMGFFMSTATMGACLVWMVIVAE